METKQRTMKIAYPLVQRIELWPIEKLIPFARNPRTHSDAQVAQIAASIAAFGFNNPILVDTKAGIIAGHGRLLAARKLQLEQVPVIVLDHLSDAQKRAYILADNQLALNAGWDEELLRIELVALQGEDFNIGLIGFEDEELARLLAAQDADGLTDEDAVPELPQTPVSMTGDLWILDSHKLLVGDATDVADVARLMAGEAADLAFTDPPYNVDYEGYTEDRLKIRGNRMSDADFKQFLEASFRSYRTLVSQALRCTFATPHLGRGSFRTPWSPPASRCAAKSSGPRIPSRGASAVISSNTSLSSTTSTWLARKIPGTVTNPNPRYGRKRSPRRTASIRQRSQWS